MHLRNIQLTFVVTFYEELWKVYVCKFYQCQDTEKLINDNLDYKFIEPTEEMLQILNWFPESKCSQLTSVLVSITDC